MAPVDRDKIRVHLVQAVHLYGEIDDEEVYRILEERLGDFDIFIASIVRHFFENSPGDTS